MSKWRTDLPSRRALARSPRAPGSPCAHARTRGHSCPEQAASWAKVLAVLVAARAFEASAEDAVLRNRLPPEAEAPANAAGVAEEHWVGGVRPRSPPQAPRRFSSRLEFVLVRVRVCVCVPSLCHEQRGLHLTPPTVIFCVLVTRTDTFIPTRCCCSVLPSVECARCVLVCTLTWDLDLLPPLRVRCDRGGRPHHNQKLNSLSLSRLFVLRVSRLQRTHTLTLCGLPTPRTISHRTAVSL